MQPIGCTSTNLSWQAPLELVLSATGQAEVSVPITAILAIVRPQGLVFLVNIAAGAEVWSTQQS